MIMVSAGKLQRWCILVNWLHLVVLDLGSSMGAARGKRKERMKGTLVLLEPIFKIDIEESNRIVKHGAARLRGKET